MNALIQLPKLASVSLCRRCVYANFGSECDALRLFCIASVNVCLLLSNATDKLSTQLVLNFCRAQIQLTNGPTLVTVLVAVCMR